MGGVADHLLPGQRQQLGRPLCRRLEQRGQRLGPPFQGTGGQGTHALDVDPVGGHAHQHVGAEPRAQLPLPALQTFRRGAGEILGKRGDLEDEVVLQVVGLGHHPPEPGLGEEVVRTVHAQEVVDEERLDLLDQVRGAADERLGVVGQRGAVPVADGEILRPHGGSVGGLPDERVLGDGRGHAAPDDGMGEPGLAEDLRHLRDVPEHVGEVADVHDAAEGGSADDAHLEVPDDRLTRGEELVHEDVPRPHADPAGRRQRPQARFGLRSHFEVVVDHRHLAVQHEVGVAGVGLEQGEQGVEHVDQIEPKLLVGLVPFAVPVRVRDDGDAARCHVRQTMACGGSRTGRGGGARATGRGPGLDGSSRPIWSRGARSSGCGRRSGTPIRSDLSSWTGTIPRGARAPATWRSGPPWRRRTWPTGGWSRGTGSCGAARPSLDSIVGLLGALRLGAVVVPVNPSVDQERTGLRRCATSRPSAALVDRPAGREWLEEIDPGCAVMLPADVLVRPARRRPTIVLELRPGPRTTR